MPNKIMKSNIVLPEASQLILSRSQDSVFFLIIKNLDDVRHKEGEIPNFKCFTMKSTHNSLSTYEIRFQT